MMVGGAVLLSANFRVSISTSSELIIRSTRRYLWITLHISSRATYELSNSVPSSSSA
jgi:hypothetical protein